MDDLIALLREGAVDFLRKPFHPDELAATLARALGQSAAPARAPGVPAVAPAPDAPPAGLRPVIPLDALHRVRTWPGPQPAAQEPDTGSEPSLDDGTLAPVEQEEPPPPVRPPPAAQPSGRSGAPPPRRPASDGSERPADPVAGLARLLKVGNYQLPAIAPIAHEIQRLMARPTCDVSEIVEVVSKDPTVMATLLRTANSTLYRGDNQVTTVRAACLRLGNKRVLALAQSAIIEGFFEIPPGPLGGVLHAMWRNVVVTAHGARELAVHLKLPEPDDIHVAAMLHNLGELVLLRLMAGLPSARSLDPARLEETAKLVRRSHERLGRRLLAGWHMPSRVVDLAGAHHHAPITPQSRAATAARLTVLVAWIGACRAGYTYLPGDEDLDPTAPLAQLQMTVEDLDRIFADAPRWLETTDGFDD